MMFQSWPMVTMEDLIEKERRPESSSSEISLNTNEVLRDLALEFGEITDGDESSSGAISLLDETTPVIQPNAAEKTLNRTEQLELTLPAAPINYKQLGLASDVDNEGTDSEICEINSKVQYNTAVYVPPMYPVSTGDLLNLGSEKQAAGGIKTQEREDVPKCHISSITDSGKTSCSSISSDEVCNILALKDSKNVQPSRPSSASSWITSSSSLEGDIESFIDEDLGEESETDIDTNRTVTRMTHSTHSDIDILSHRSITVSSKSLLPSKDVRNRISSADVATPTLLQKVNVDYDSPTSSSSEVSLVDVKSKMIRRLADKISNNEDGFGKTVQIPEVTRLDENATSFLTRKLNLLRTQKATEKKSPMSSAVTKDKEFSVEHVEVVPTNWIDRLQLKAFKAKLETLAKDPIHNPHECISCREAADAVDQKNVLRSLLLRAQRPLMEERIENHLLTHNSITLIGELARTLSQAQQPISQQKL